MLHFIKQNKKELIYATILCVIFCMPLFADYIYNGYDIRFHLNRIVGIGDALRDGQFLPKIYPYTNNGYGYASPLFYCDLFLYPFAILYLLGIPLVIAYKLMIAFYVLVGNILMLIFLKNISVKNSSCYLPLTLYALANYRLIDCYSRAAFGELLALSFVPLVMLAIYNVLYKKKDSYLLLALGFSLLLLSHNLSFALYCLLYGILIIVFLICHRSDKKAIQGMLITTFKAVTIALLLCLWYLLPMLEQLLVQDLWIGKLGEMYRLSNNYLEIESFAKPLLQLDNKSNMSVSKINTLGYSSLLVLVYGLVHKNNLMKYVAIFTLVILLFATGIIPIAQIIPLFNGLQFSFRWLILIFPLIVFLATHSFKNRYLNLILIILLLINSFTYSIQLIKNDDYISNNSHAEELFDFSGILHKDYNENQISGGEYLPITLYNDYLEETTFIKRVNEDGKYEDVVYDLDRNFSKIKFNYSSKGDELIMLPLTYYKGYECTAIKDGSVVSLETINIDTYHKVGIMSLTGDVVYTIQYKGTALQHCSLAISLITLLVIPLVEYNKRRSKNEKEDIICK